ncbi:MAG: hypothetical protein ACKV0T_28280 [Planctomycetales bacterium]
MNDAPLDWEERLRVGLGDVPSPDFDAWCDRHPDAVAALQPVAAAVQAPALQTLRTRRYLMASFKWMAAAALLAGGLAWMGSGGGNLSPSAFADAIPGVDGVQTMTWTDTYFIRFTSEDGQRTWIQKERRLHAYRHPGQYRETMLNEQGETIAVHITDQRAGRMVALDEKGRKAVLKAPVLLRGERGPFAWVGEIIRERKSGSESSRVKSVSLQGQKEIDKIRANVVRATLQSLEGRPEFRYDFLFDAASKQLVGIWTPNEADLEFETATDRNKPAEEKWRKMAPIAALTHEIVLNPKLDPSDFSLDPPAGYAFVKIAKPTVTEEEMLAYLGAAARFNDDAFPDSPYSAFDSDKFNVASEKKQADRTAAEQALIDIRDKIMMREIYRSPIKQFEEDHTAPNSFHYVGSGVKVGQGDRIIGWYKLRTATTFRAIYGDLSIKDIAASELPLDVSK